MNKRVLIGTADIARNVYNLTRGFRELGYQADSLVFSPSRFYDPAYTLTHVDFLDDLVWETDEIGNVTPQVPSSFYDFVNKYDIFVFISGSTLLPRMTDLPLLKKMGKTVISRHSGTEVRDYELARIFWNAYERHYPYYLKDKEAPRIQCSTEDGLLGLSRYHPALASKMHNTRMSELYADALFSGPPSHTLALRPYFQSGPAIDTSHIVYKLPLRKVPVILHAPSSSLYKQTDLILNMLRELEEEGLEFKVQLLQEVPNAEVCRAITEADIVIDELSCGSGVLAFEGMAGGCAVLGGHDNISSPLPRNRPVLNINRENFKEAVRRVVLDIPFRKRLARMGRDYIQNGISSPAANAQYTVDGLTREKRGEYDLFPTLFADMAFIPQGEPMPDYLKQRTLEVLLRYGAHPDTDLARLHRQGLLPEGCENRLKEIPRWDIARLVQRGPWILMHETAEYGATQPVPIIEPEELAASL
jgi:hypothetical protein